MKYIYMSDIKFLPCWSGEHGKSSAASQVDLRIISDNIIFNFAKCIRTSIHQLATVASYLFIATI